MRTLAVMVLIAGHRPAVEMTTNVHITKFRWQMIKTSVVFILGAGASWPYKYPLGSDLKTQLQNVGGDTRTLLEDLDHSKEAIDWFGTALEGSLKPSIDAFLANREEFRDLGKRMIADNIIRRERKQDLFGDSDGRWYPKLFDKLIGRNSSFESLDFSNTTIVTFNYDRSLEECLHHSLSHSYVRTPEAIVAVMQTLRIIHVYGHVGALDWQEVGGRPYGTPVSHHIVRDAAKQIRIVAEGIGDNDAIAEAQRRIKSASAVFLLGNAYHDDNMQLLGFPLVGPGARQPHGSGYGLTTAMRTQITNRYKVWFKDANVTNYNCADFLDDSDLFQGLE
jgi:hypothetical protein